MRGKLIRRAIEAHNLPQPVRFAFAVRCYPGGRDVSSAHIKACGQYLRQEIEDTRPSRIIALGQDAAEALLGRAINAQDVRRAYGWLTVAGADVPVMCVLRPLRAIQNKHLRKWFEADMKWACVAHPYMPGGLYPPPYARTFTLIETVIDSIAACNQLAQSAGFAFDVETEGRLFLDQRLLSLAAAPLSKDESAPIYVWDKSALTQPAITQPLRALLSNKDVPKAGHNLKYDILAVENFLKCRVQGICLDTMLQWKLFYPDAFGALGIVGEVVGMGGHKDEAGDALEDELKLMRAKPKKAHPKQLAMFDAQAELSPAPQADPFNVEEATRRARENHPKSYAYARLQPELLWRYNAADALATARLAILFDERFDNDPDLDQVYKQVTEPAIRGVAHLEQNGVAADLDALRTFQSYLYLAQDSARAALRTYGDFNPDSNPEVAELLFKKMGLTPPKVTDGGNPSVDKEALEALQEHHPVVRDLLEYRKLAKMRSTYADGMLAHIKPDGRIHTTYRIDGARTGRMSSAEPNLQNIPSAKSDLGRMAKNIFVAPYGYKLMQFDYSQLEVRIAAMLSADPDLKRALLSEDIHRATAAMVFNKAPELVTDDERRFAKTIVFGLLYGMGDETLAGKLHIVKAEAARIRNAILGRFKRLAKWIEERIAETSSTGYAFTQWNGKRARRRPLWGIGEREGMFYSTAKNSSVNAPVQGTASDYCLASLAACVQWLEDDAVPAKLVLTVHDSLIFEVRNDSVHEVAEQVRRVMCGWPSDDVQLKVDVEIGQAWGNLKKYLTPAEQSIAMLNNSAA
jgi:uracil-DNA glycosylase family 4